MKQLAHIINPVKVKESSDLYYAQPISFQSIRAAKKEVSNLEVYTTQFKEDEGVAPKGFIKLPSLLNNVNDKNPSLKTKKLPLIKDIINTLYSNSNADYFIYSNVDIALMPFFYTYVNTILDKGFDGLVINRRRLSALYLKKPLTLSELYACMGSSHPGFDCFVFKRSIVPQFVFGDICLGAAYSGVSLAHNVFAFSKNPLYISNKHLSFHLGMDVLSGRKKDAYYKHNKKEYFNVVEPAVLPYFNFKKLPYSNKNYLKKALYWSLNPSLFSKHYIHLSKKDVLSSIKSYLDEIRWHFLEK